ncbi:hypothetical protein [Pedobacter montanisoli]|uniref:Outer membrane protein beta-barrel domain-containing protein n=1 Tax=Pedobacter montanisoli TaxID=2923277 RepID=A0ABS9ZXR1_9SPHI|nr:hypothetical protein [Pedobacter montanisoli]MCJ0743077.1 hypothetical protein [Pedobacter montanisoli]
MKIKLTFIGILLISTYSYAQIKILDTTKKDTAALINVSYQFKYDLNGLQLEELFYERGNKQEGITDQKVPPGGYKIKALYEKQGYVYYKYWEFEDSSLQSKYNDGKIFKMKKENFMTITNRLYQKYKGAKVGAYTIPFRLRGINSDDFDFETALSLQANVVFGFGQQTKPESWLDLSWGLGLTRINLDSDNSKVTENRTASALTTSLGALIKPDKYVNLGLFVGWDFLGKKDKEVEWIYNKRPWLGIGINISFDGISTTKTTDKNSQ